MSSLFKQCKKCGKTFEKESTCSLKRWITTREFCSQRCLFTWRRNNIEYKSKLNLGGLDLGHKKGNTNGFIKGFIPWNKNLKGIHLSPKTEFKIGQLSGDKHPLWQGGITPLNAKLRSTPAYRKWRKEVVERDNNACIWCGSTEHIQADHIKPFAYFPELRFIISNGRTLCEPCHKLTDTYAAKARLHLLA